MRRLLTKSKKYAKPLPPQQGLRRPVHYTSVRSDAVPLETQKDSSIAEQVREKQLQEAEKRKEAWLYFDTAFPIRLSILDPRVWFAKTNQEAVLDSIKRAIPADGSDIGLQVEKVESRDKDGGAFVKISYLPIPSLFNRVRGTAAEAEKNEEILNEAIESWVRRQVKKSNVQYKPWFLFGPDQIYLVRGKPFMEDMDKYPNSIIKIEFEGGGPLPLESIYEICRPYGRIQDINIDAKAATATIFYRRTRYAAAARNCLDGLKTQNRIFHILYEKRTTGNSIREWLSNHPRIVLPIMAVLLGGLSFLIFDPIRAFFIESKVVGRFDLDKYRAFTWLRRETLGRLGLDKASTSDKQITGIEKERQEAATMLDSWLRDWPDGFITITGPRGSGKEPLISGIMQSHRNVLFIDCDAICKRGSEDKVVKELAAQTGYFPLFGFLSQFNNLIDLASVGLIGTKAGFATSSQEQIKSILNVSAAALTSLSAEAKSSQALAVQVAEEKMATKEQRAEIRHSLEEEGIKDGRMDALAGNGAISELGHGIEREKGMNGLVIAGPSSLAAAQTILTEKDTEAAIASVSKDLPVVILKGFNSKEGRNKDQLWDEIAEWGANLVENKIAHVVATSDNVLVTKPLAKALPSKPTNSIMLADASAENALDYVLTKLGEIGKADVVQESNKKTISLLGGRLSDLEILVQKLRGGAQLDEAVEDMIIRSSTEVKKTIFGDGKEEAKSKEWTQAQAWYLAQLFTKQDEASYEDVLFNGPFGGDDKPLHALEQAEMVSVVHREGVPSLLKPGKPIWRAAFHRLCADPVFTAVQKLSINSAATATAANDIKSAQAELIALGTLFPSNNGKWLLAGSTYSGALVTRIDNLLAKIHNAQEKQKVLAEESAALKAVLKL